MIPLRASRSAHGSKTRHLSILFGIASLFASPAGSQPADPSPAPPPPSPLSNEQVTQQLVLSGKGLSKALIGTPGQVAAGASTDAATPDLFTGAVRSEIVVPVPPGRAGLQPSIAISYSSANRADGAFGIGWDLSLGSVQKINGPSGSLTKYSYNGPLGHLELDEVSPDVYRPQVSTARITFRKIERGGTDYWESLESSGIRTTYGVSSAARTIGGDDLTNAWHVSEVSDPSGNYTTFNFTCRGAPLASTGCKGALVPKSVEYVGHRPSGMRPRHCVVFRTEQRGDPVPIVRDGRRLGTLDVRVRSVETYPGFLGSCDEDNQTAQAAEARFEFVYATAHRTHRSRLTGVQVRGGAGTLGPMRREYSYIDSVMPDTSGAPSLVLATKNAQNRGNEFSDAAAAQRFFADVNGNAFSDFCSYRGAQRFTCIEFAGGGASERKLEKLGELLNKDELRRDVTVVGLFANDLNRDGRSDICAVLFLSDQSKRLDCWLNHEGERLERVPTPVSWPMRKHFNNQSVTHEVKTLLSTLRFPDLNNDGVPELCWRDVKDGLTCRLVQLEKSGSISFVDGPVVPPEFRTGEFAVPPYRSPFSSDPNQPPIDPDPDRYFKTLQFVDLTNDGRAEICARTPSGVRCYLNVNGQWTTRLDGPLLGDPVDVSPADPNAPSPAPPVFVGGADWKRESHYASIQFSDINRDGLVDLCARDLQGIACYLGRGIEGFQSAPMRGPQWSEAGWDRDERHFRSVALIDLNDDGYADLCGNVPGQGLRCHEGGPSGFSLQPSLKLDLPINEPDGVGDVFKTLAYSDVNGDGKPDICFFRAAGLSCYLSSPERHDLLSSIAYSTGRHWTLNYEPSSHFKNRRLPLSIPVLSSLVETGSDFVADVDSDRPATVPVQVVTTYSYEGGYFNPETRDFLGFRRVSVSSPSRNGVPTSRVVRAFEFYQARQDADLPLSGLGGVAHLKGKVRSDSLSESSGRRHSLKEFRYAIEAEDKPAIPKLIETLSYDCLTTQRCSDPIRIEAQFDDLGNKIVELHHGNPSSSADDVRVEFSYVKGHPLFTALPTRMDTYAGLQSPLKLATTLYFFDESDQCGATNRNFEPTLASEIRRGLVTREVRLGAGGSSIVLSRAYDEYGNLVCDSDGLARVQLVEYDNLFSSFVVSRRTPLGHSATVRYAGVNAPASVGLFGQIVEEVDANGATVRFKYDEFGRLTSSTRPDGSWITQEYEDLISNTPGGKMTLRTSEGGRTTQSLDQKGRIWRIESDAAERRSVVVLTRYDQLGQVVARSGPFFAGTQPRTWTRQFWDVVGRLSRVTAADGTALARCYYDKAELRIEKNGTLERRTKDYFGRLIGIEQYDEKVDVNGPDPCSFRPSKALLRTSVEYDRLGRVVAVVDPKGRRIRTEYDDFGRVSRTIDPDLGMTISSHDDAGNLVYRKDATGNEIFLTYDKADRLLQKDYGQRNPLGQGDVLFEYDRGDGQLGRLTGSRTRTNEAQYRYDLVGNRVESTIQVGGQSYNLKFGFNKGQLERVIYPDGFEVQYDFDQKALTRVKVANTGVVLAQFSDFGADGNPRLVNYGDAMQLKYAFGDGNGDNCSNLDGRICAVGRVDSTGMAPAHAWGLQYGYNAEGAVASVQSVSSQQPLVQYSYDAIGRLVGADGGLWPGKYEYDEIGNVLNAPHLNEPIEFGTFSIQEGFRTRQRAAILVGDKRQEFDQAGRLTAVVGHQWWSSRTDYFFDPESRLIRASKLGRQATFEYDGAGKLVSVRSMGSNTVNIENLFECERELFSRRCYRHIFAGSLRFSSLEADGDRAWYYLVDHQGSVTAVADAHGRIVERISYSPYGLNSRTSHGDEKVPDVVRSYGFQGKRLDQAFELYYFGARHYSPLTGRFITPDDRVYGAPRDGAYNRYAYALNDPVNVADPNGECPICVAVVVGAVVGGFIAGEQSNWDFNEVFRGAVIGGVSGAFGFAAGTAFAGTAFAGSLAGAAPFAAAAVGGAVSSSISTLAYNPDADLFQAASNGALMGAVGFGAGQGVQGALVTGLVSSAVYKDDFGPAFWRSLGGSLVSTGVGTLATSKGTVNGPPPQSGAEARVYYPRDFTSYLLTFLIGGDFSHVAIAFEDGTIADQSTGGQGVSRFRASDRDVPRSAALMDRPYRVLKPVSSAAASGYYNDTKGLQYLAPSSILKGSAVCTTWVSGATNNAVIGITPGQMYWRQNFDQYSGYWWQRQRKD